MLEHNTISFRLYKAVSRHSHRGDPVLCSAPMKSYHTIALAFVFACASKHVVPDNISSDYP